MIMKLKEQRAALEWRVTALTSCHVLDWSARYCSWALELTKSVEMSYHPCRLQIVGSVINI